MKKINSKQYNQSISKYKLLSRNAGVGSIVNSKFGISAIVCDINKWNFIQQHNDGLKQKKEDSILTPKIIKNLSVSRGLRPIDDSRFINALRIQYNLRNLECLIEIPNMPLNEMNYVDKWVEGKHEIQKTLKEQNQPPTDAKYYQPIAMHFPRWFMEKRESGKRKLQLIHKWKEEWKGNRHNFTPPKQKTPTGEKKLLQTNLLLICENGHMSDIPWSKYLNWKSKDQQEDDLAFNLLTEENCCTAPNLYWSENTYKAEGFNSVYIECQNCNQKTNLGGINKIRPKCIGEKPWQAKESYDSGNPYYIPKESCKNDSWQIQNEDSSEENDRQSSDVQMQVALTTANNVYYANSHSSIYIPKEAREGHNETHDNVITELNKSFERRNQNRKKRGKNEQTKIEFYKTVEDELDDFIDDHNIERNDDLDYTQIRLDFLNSEEEKIDEQDFNETYRYEEYHCFNSKTSFNSPKLSFKDIQIPEKLTQYFTKIQQIDEIRLTSVQLDFNRVRPKEFVRINDSAGSEEIRQRSNSQRIYSEESDNIFVIPAHETRGEGLFFKFNETYIDLWISENKELLNAHYEFIIDRNLDEVKFGADKQYRIQKNCFRHYLIHSFSHILMKELEFTCGYPTSSLKERLYISNQEEKNMSGLLIYTADGAEGSMGGLVTQGRSRNIEKVVFNGIKRSVNCSSDPLCWEMDSQGVQLLNKAACYSCSLVSETACEEQNLALDRRILVDESFGFFKDLL